MALINYHKSVVATGMKKSSCGPMITTGSFELITLPDYISR